MKFGGTSVESASAIQRVAAIVKANLAACPVVVVSAIGKSTNRLLHAAECAAQGEGNAAWRKLLGLEADHLQIAAKLGLSVDRDLERLFNEVRSDILEVASLRTLTPAMWDRIASFGERLSSLIVTAALTKAGVPARHFDARTLIVTDGHHTAAAPLTIETYAKVRRAIPCPGGKLVPVLGGFIAATEEGTPTTLGRGGSDLTASLIGAAINAEEVEIWTDVDGMLTCDPRIAPCGKCLRSLSYAEAEQMARFGAKVLHPDTVVPARKQRVPVSIRNSHNPLHPGTMIQDYADCTGRVKSIASLADEGILCLVGAGIGLVPEIMRRSVAVLQTAGIHVEAGPRTDLSILLNVAPSDVPAAVRAIHAEFFGAQKKRASRSLPSLPLSFCGVYCCWGEVSCCPITSPETTISTRRFC